ncbi:MAG: hypothetical protein ACKVOG_12890 [Rhodoglobus sp.]
MAATELHRPTAGQLDGWSRVAGLGIVVGLLVGLIPPLVLELTGPVAVLVLAVLVVGPAIASTVLGLRAVGVAKLERASGYSTMYDFAGYELRDPRTLEVLRPADVRPTGIVRRSLFRSMLTVKPGTMLAKRLDEDERAEREQ